LLQKVNALARLVRPRHTAQVVGIVAILSISSHGFSTLSLYTVLSSFFLSIAIFFLDDAHDYESDIVIHAQRPIPERLITVRQAYLGGAVALAIGVFLASLLLFHQFLIFLISATVAVAVIFVSIQSTLRACLNAFLIWSLFPFAAFPDLKTVLFGLIVALPHVGGSIMKDVLHQKGDEVQRLKGPPEWSRYLASVAFLAAAVVACLSPLLGLVSWLYVPPTMVTQVCCVILAVKTLKRHYEKVYVYGAIGMLSSLAAFLLGRL
jgi:4-hydroxybenzoate polyprenyltransferase